MDCQQHPDYEYTNPAFGASVALADDPQIILPPVYQQPQLASTATLDEKCGGSDVSAMWQSEPRTNILLAERKGVGET